MAEAAVETQILRFFCHKCSQEINPVLPDYTCPRCQSGFIEELTQNGTEIGEESDEENIDPSVQFAELWRELIQDVFRREEMELNQSVGPVENNGRQPQSAVEGDENPSFASSSLLRHMRRRRPRPRDARQLREMRVAEMEGSDIGWLQQLLTSLSAGNRGYQSFSGFPIFFNLHGNPGDYAWGRGGLDAVISQLLNQLDGTGPPPLPKEKIEEIPDVEISREQVDKSLQCTVCMEDFRVLESVKRLTCSHHFHRDCIIPWLELHGTCPICRKLLHESAQNCANLDTPSTSNSSTNNSSSSAGGANSTGSSSSRSSSTENSSNPNENVSSSSGRRLSSMYDYFDDLDNFE